MAELEFEKPILELERKIADLQKFSFERKINLSNEIDNFESKLGQLKQEIYGNLNAWQKVQISRHTDRPTTLDYTQMIMKDFIELHGDRVFGDDKALITGLANIDGNRIAVVGHQKGRDTKENLDRNFGCAHPEGYRKAMRLFKLAERFSLPVVCFIDTPGAYPGVGAEERGQAHSIAENIRDMFEIKTPIIVVVIGEGGSGGALGIGVGNKVAMLEYSYYSVISPEGCSAILWRERAKAEEAAKALKLTAVHLLELGIIDEIIKEPLGGAHRDAIAAGDNLKEFILHSISEFKDLSTKKLIENRYQKFRNMGVVSESSME
ncbi:MAG: acetyl-CoA carboxylase carboxyltransferase subunit alpha [Candidatus Saelkia tenebricola]|nr:acetyl-CoA carboxylase carboxyltransferase subunit alpha [Candidatus Saelkia tenebricola]